MRIIIFLGIIWMAGCGIRSSEAETAPYSSDDTWPVTLIDTQFPLRLGEVDLSKTPVYDVEDEVEARIRKTVNDYSTRACMADSVHTSADVYVNTIRLRDSLQTVFLVLLRHFPTSNVDSRILFYNNGTRSFVGDAIDFKIYALYDLEKGRLKPSYLKELLKIDHPEIAQVDHNEDGIMDYRVTRLYHNGTFNAIRTCVLSPKGSRVDALFFNEKPFSIE